MSAQFDDLPDEVKTEVQAFTDVNVAWLKRILIAAKVANPKGAEKRARAIYSGIVGAQLMARSRSNIALYDRLIESYRTAGLLPA
jgi:TetR/AcrR family transcriptional repressor of nem operon